jgi:hypothetical protein
LKDQRTAGKKRNVQTVQVDFLRKSNLGYTMMAVRRRLLSQKLGTYHQLLNIGR